MSQPTSPLADLILNDAKVITDKVDFGEIKGKSIMITGASGLVGHYLVAALNQAAKNGHAPSALYLVMKSEAPEYFKDLLIGLPVKIVLEDLSDASSLSDLPEADYIIHAAGYGQPGKFMNDPVKTLKLNTIGTFGTIEKLKPCGKYLFISTSEVYSGLTKPPFREDQIGTTNTDHVRSCYIEGKRAGEAIINAYRAKGYDAKSARLSLAYGPGTRKDDARVINNFIKKGLVDKKIDLMDAGEAMRTYLYVTDAVEFLFSILFSGKEATYNVGGKSQTTIGELAKLTGTMIGVPVNFPKSETGVSGAPDDVSLDMNKAEKEFGKNDYLSLEDGLQKTIEWQRMLYSN